MEKDKPYQLNRRNFIKISAATTAGATLLPLDNFAIDKLPAPMKRKFGKIDFEVTTLGLGGQASLQWTPEDVDPVPIILKAFRMGVNYFDTSNLYGPSQMNFGKAFRTLNLVPGEPGYDEALRKSIFLTTKTHIRWGNNNFPPDSEKVRNWTNGDHGLGAIGDLKRSLSQLFGDGKGYYPDGAYVDMILAHNLNFMEEVDVLFKGLETPLDPNGEFGAFVALRDYRDGTNLTGLNPKHEKLVKHIGFSGHYSAPVMMEMIQRDQYGILDAMLVAINLNDRRMFNMQYNAIPLAKAKNMGVIAMKVFADGAMYDKDAKWSNNPSDVVRRVGTPAIPSRPLVEYALTTPGVHTAIIGIGHIDDDPMKCQLVQNFYAAQVEPESLTEAERRKIEELGLKAKDGQANYFQIKKNELSAPNDVSFQQQGNTAELAWGMAFAGDEPVSHYEILKNGKKVDEKKHVPICTKDKHLYRDTTAQPGDEYQVVAVDRIGRQAASEPFNV
ncbi:aldo/keto reductase [Gaoshiqia sediminis]|uniref:Aldo/keto reductase n=1 Tax=Gaoshiqia sediminis TaxID=2986998 RepID=A0AA42C6L1_9BACT|nr:aldo/keto reductase [Gaoshiqia sediminis]MCW0482644.1 aldo/keto reductase [Gaoshiqia sediminis]